MNDIHVQCKLMIPFFLPNMDKKTIGAKYDCEERYTSVYIKGGIEWFNEGEMTIFCFQNRNHDFFLHWNPRSISAVPIRWKQVPVGADRWYWRCRNDLRSPESPILASILFPLTYKSCFGCLKAYYWRTNRPMDERTDRWTDGPRMDKVSFDARTHMKIFRPREVYRLLFLHLPLPFSCGKRPCSRFLRSSARQSDHFLFSIDVSTHSILILSLHKLV